MSDNNDNMSPLEEYIMKDLGADDAEFAEYMSTEDRNCRLQLIDKWLQRKRKQEKEVADMKHPEGEPIVILQPSHEELAKSQRAKEINMYLNCNCFCKETAKTALTRMGHIIDDLTAIKHQWKKANSAKDVQVVFQSFHRWGFKDHKTFSTAYDGLLALRDELGGQLLNPDVGNVILVLQRPKRERDDDKDEDIAGPQELHRHVKHE